MPDLLLELFSEEIPARMQEQAIYDLRNGLHKGFAKEALITIDDWKEGNLNCTFFVTPRRLAVWVKDLPTTQLDNSTELKGPKTNAPDAALQGFIKKNNLQKNHLIERDGVYFAHVHTEVRPTAEVLKIAIEDILANFPWPKSMRWGAGDVTWVRPLHSILCIFDGKVVAVQFGNVTAGNVTYGHRFLAPQAIIITKAEEYEGKLREAYVIANREKRKADILRQAQTNASETNCSLKQDDGLLEEVTGLVELPSILTGHIDQKFMDLPPEVLTTVMRSHQKYFSLLDKDGKLASHFLIVANMETQDAGKAIVAGNERVLRARFSDARFFWDQDRKKPLDEWAKGLASVTFHAKLGTVADKVGRVKMLALTLMPYVHPDLRRDDVERAASLCKADLVTGMVGEFAELQGIMGRYYALQQKESPEVADAIRDHYKPQGPNDSVPNNPISICVALADKIDTLESLFAANEKPTGSKDPFALRRAALGIIRIILENKLRFNFGEILQNHKIAIANNLTPIKGPQIISSLDPHDAGFHNNILSILPFLSDRLKVQLKDSGIRHDVINAVVADGDDDLVRVVMRAKALQDFLATDDGANLLVAYKRAANIVNLAEEKDNTKYTGENRFIDNDKYAIKLASALSNTLTSMKNSREGENFSEMMRDAASLRNPIDEFFINVLINTEDTELRIARLRILAWIRDAFDEIANFALIEGDIKEQRKAA